jgi:prephenate dehydrogenase
VRVAVLGVGLVGGSIGLAARERLGCEVAGWGPNRPTLERAEELGAVDRSAASVAEACEGAEIVFCAAPVSVLPELARQALAASGRETAVTDAGSTKREIVAELGGDERFVGGHPLAGAETAGVGNARADLFAGARWYLTPTDRTSAALQERVREAIAGLGARPQAIDAAAHDRLMATVSHLPHVFADVLVGLAAAELSRDSELLPDVGPSFRDATRVAGSNPAIWGDIFAANREAVAAAIDDAIVRLDEARALIRAGDAGAIAAWHAAAGTLLDALDSSARARGDEG